MPLNFLDFLIFFVTNKFNLNGRNDGSTRYLLQRERNGGLSLSLYRFQSFSLERNEKDIFVKT